MGFVFVTEAPDITEQIPVQLGGQFRRAIEAANLSQGFDVAVGDVSFVLRPDAQHPYQRGLAQIEKNQFDTSTDAGEQSLGAWWTRAQNDFRGGSGVRWYEPGADQATQDTFWRSQGVDVWDVEGAKMLRAMSEVDAHTGVGYVSTYDDAVVHVAGTTLDIYDPSGASTATHTVSAGVSQPAVGGGHIWVGTTTGIDRVTPSTANLDWFTHGTACRVWHMKERLIVASGNELYWVSPSQGTGTLAAQGTLIYTHPSPTWEWVDVAETPNSIVVAGREGTKSALYTIGLASTTPSGTNLPDLDMPQVAWETPTTEQITAIGAYLGTYLVVGTTRGVRIALVTESGISTGQLSLETDSVIADISFHDRFTYVTSVANIPDGTTGCWRIDLSRPLGETTQYATASDVTTELAGTNPSIAFVGGTDRVVLRTTDGLFFTTTDTFVTDSWLETGQVRFRTNELKMFANMKVTGDLTHGQMVSEFQVTGTGRWEPLATLDTHATLDVDHAIPFPSTGSVRLRFTFSPSATDSPVLGGWTLKALPVMKRPRIIRLPLSLADFEIVPKGTKYGYQGWAVDRRLVLEALLDAERAIPIKYAGDPRIHVVTIEDYLFTNITAGDGALDNKGGVVDLTIREIAIVE